MLLLGTLADEPSQPLWTSWKCYAFSNQSQAKISGAKRSALRKPTAKQLLKRGIASNFVQCIYIYIYTSCFLRAWIQDFLDSHNKIDAFLVLRFFTRQPLPKTPSKTTSSIWAVSSTSLLLRDYPQKLVKKMVRQKLAPKLLRRVKIDRPPKSSIALAWCRLSLWQE